MVGQWSYGKTPFQALGSPSLWKTDAGAVQVVMQIVGMGVCRHAEALTMALGELCWMLFNLCQQWSQAILVERLLDTVRAAPSPLWVLWAGAIFVSTRPARKLDSTQEPQSGLSQALH